MSLEESKSLVRRFIDEVMNAGNTAAITDLCVPDSMFATGIAGQVQSLKVAFPDHRFTVEEMLAEGDKVAVRVTVHGTNRGPLLGLPAFGRLEQPVPPTGKSMSSTGIAIYTVRNGRIVSLDSELDQIGLLRQLGWTFVPPSPG
jgi:predicted ester cyclase